jgi:hypothetical protein
LTERLGWKTGDTPPASEDAQGALTLRLISCARS